MDEVRAILDWRKLISWPRRPVISIQVLGGLFATTAGISDIGAAEKTTVPAPRDSSTGFVLYAVKGLPAEQLTIYSSLPGARSIMPSI
jgi:hypothetical protein